MLGKIRRLEYEESADFIADLDRVVSDALFILGNRSKPLHEASKTLGIICTEQFSTHQRKFNSVDGKIRRAKLEDRDGQEITKSGDQRKWPIRWRQECGSFEDSHYVRLEAKTLEEWTAFVTGAAMYASCLELDQSASNDRSVMSDAVGHDDIIASGPTNRPKDVRSRNETIAFGRSSVPTLPGLTLSEGTDVMIALEALSQVNQDQRRQFGGLPSNDTEDMDTRELFLSPSTSEMQHMFDQQSNILRRALEAHTALQRAWYIEKQQVLGLGQESGISVGEGRLAVELRAANKVCKLAANVSHASYLIDLCDPESSCSLTEQRQTYRPVGHGTSKSSGRT